MAVATSLLLAVVLASIMAATNTHRAAVLVFDWHSCPNCGRQCPDAGQYWCRRRATPTSDLGEASHRERSRLVPMVSRYPEAYPSLVPGHSRGPVFDIVSLSELRTTISAHRTNKAPSSRDVDLRPRRGQQPLKAASRVRGVSLSRGVPVARARSPCSAPSNESPCSAPSNEAYEASQLREPVATVAPEPEPSY